MKKYTYSILVLLDKYGKLRFNELQRKIFGLTQRSLSIRLKELEKAKLVKRVVETTEPVKVYYMITTEGKAVKNAIQILISLVNLLDNSNNKDEYLC
ncbi:Transcriptional regulator, HxlR family [Saccharolobus shibatae]|uniref:Transcriptional regulator, HxlR family n=2 Tax=Saccharolobus shibatae TaxID=2286 RepID=A0A8F5GZV7_9CREN|nr:Transcriptional regulator, HxlR family [Saccharolobus shibatae]